MSDLKSMAVNIGILLMFMNAAPNLMVASGVAADWGIMPEVGGGEHVEEANSAMKTLEPSGGFADTLFQLYTSATAPIAVFVGIIAGGPIILASIGIPSWLLAFVFVPQYLVMGGTVLYMLAGRKL